jgi:hypothetical protein
LAALIQEEENPPLNLRVFITGELSFSKKWKWSSR